LGGLGRGSKWRLILNMALKSPSESPMIGSTDRTRLPEKRFRKFKPSGPVTGESLPKVE